MCPVSGFAYKIRHLRVSDLLRTYMICALEATYAYDVRILRESDLLRTLYVFCAQDDLLHTMYVFLRSRRLMLQDLSVRPCDDWDRAMTAVTEGSCWSV